MFLKRMFLGRDASVSGPSPPPPDTEPPPSPTSRLSMKQKDHLQSYALCATASSLMLPWWESGMNHRSSPSYSTQTTLQYRVA